MKTRIGFVSNSSSSSFIIAIDRGYSGSACPTCGMSKLDIIDILDRMDNHTGDCSCIKERGVAKIKARHKEEFQWLDKEEKEEVRGLIKRLKKIEQEGREVYRIRINYNDSYLLEYIENSKHIEVLDSVY